MNNTLIGKTFLRLGLVSFGGPTAHIGYFRDELVKEKKWLLEDDFSSLLAICQALPGPTSSQMVFSIGLKKGGFLTAYIALIAFSFPSVFLMIFAIWGGLTRWFWIVFHGLFASNRQNSSRIMENQRNTIRKRSRTSLTLIPPNPDYTIL